jgi:hypothetical protein
MVIESEPMGASGAVSFPCGEVEAVSFPCGDVVAIRKISPSLPPVHMLGTAYGNSGRLRGQCVTLRSLEGRVVGSPSFALSGVSSICDAEGEAVGAAAWVVGSCSVAVLLSGDVRGADGHGYGRIGGLVEVVAFGDICGQAGAVEGSVDAEVLAAGASAGVSGVVVSSASPAVGAAGSALGESGNLDSIVSASVDCSGNSAGSAAILTSAISAVVDVQGPPIGVAATIASSVGCIVSASCDLVGSIPFVSSTASAGVDAAGKATGAGGTLGSTASIAIVCEGNPTGEAGMLDGSCSTDSEESDEFDINGAIYCAVAPSGYVYSEAQNTHYGDRNYNTLDACIDDLVETLTAFTVVNVLGEWTENDTAAVNKTVVTSAAYQLVIRAIGTARASNASTRWRLVASVGSGYVLYLTTDYVNFDGLCVQNTSAADYSRAIQVDSSAAGEVTVSSCVLLATATTEGSAACGYSSAGGTFLAKSSYTNGGVVGFSLPNVAHAHVHQCTIKGATYGLVAYGEYVASLTAKNVGFSGVTYTSYSDAFALTTCSTSTPTFEADGYHLASGDTTWRGGGTDLSGDADLPVTLDIDGDTISVWPIGCDE